MSCLSEPNFLQLRELSFGYAGRPLALHSVDLSLAFGELHCLLGRSGCGKTTLLKLAAGLLQPSTGDIQMRGSAKLDPRAVGFMFQQANLLDWLSVMDNVLLPLSLKHQPTVQEHQQAKALLKQLGLESEQHRYPRQLSGGQQSRVALARALILRPPLLLLDEPFSALDAITREELQRDLLLQCRQDSITALFVTHDIAEAVFLGDRVSVLAGGRLVHTLNITSKAARDSAGFGAYCAQLRALLSGNVPNKVRSDSEATAV